MCDEMIQNVENALKRVEKEIGHLKGTMNELELIRVNLESYVKNSKAVIENLKRVSKAAQMEVRNHYTTVN